MSVSSGPFVTNSPYGNANFTPVKIGTRSNTANESKSASKVAKPVHPEKHASTSINRYNRKKNQNEGKVTMQIEEEEDLDEYSIKHVAAARYLRNHRLINEVFGDACVPDMRNFVNNERMIKLKGQVQSLTQHQKRLEAEVKQINEKFESKKRKFIESSERFQAEMKRMCAKKIDATMYQEMVDQAIEQLKIEQQKRDELKKQEEVAKSQISSNSVVENSTQQITSTALPTVSNVQQQTQQPTHQQSTQPTVETKKIDDRPPAAKTVESSKDEQSKNETENVEPVNLGDQVSSDKPATHQTDEKMEVDTNVPLTDNKTLPSTLDNTLSQQVT